MRPRGIHMKHKLLARLIKKMIQPEATEYFNEKLAEFDGDMNALLSSEETIDDLSTFLQNKQEQAIKVIKAEYDIDIDQFDLKTKNLIFNEVEYKIFYS